MYEGKKKFNKSIIKPLDARSEFQYMNTTTLQYLLDHLAQDSILILELSRTIFLSLF